jgi:DNA-binding transcriptional ArsR family regulator
MFSRMETKTSFPVQPRDEEIEQELEIRDIDALKALANPLRVRVLRTLMPQRRSAKQVAQALGEGVTKLYRHIKILEQHGFVHAVAHSMVSGIAEIQYRARARSFVVSRAALAEPGQVQSTLDGALAFVLDRARISIKRSVEDGRIDLMVRAPEPNALLARRTFAKISPARAREFYQRLLALYDEFTSEHDDSDGRLYALTMTLSPTSDEAEVADLSASDVHDLPGHD